MRLNFKEKNIEIPVQKLGFFGRYIGLMFKSKNTKNLLFEFKNNTRNRIHSFFVFFPFIILWLNEKNQVLEWKIVSPFSLAIKPRNEFRRFIEVPFNIPNKKIIKFFVGRKDLNIS